MEQGKRFWLALGMYAVLAMLAWATMSSEPLGIAHGRISISFRGFTVFLLGVFAMRTVLHWRAERIRAESSQHD
jgi:ABC-type transport system involved in cytochrome bd biosynthesis fused ATPase/permease subunit